MRPETKSAGPVRVLELRSVRGTGGGPEKTILLGAAKADPARARVTVCYVRDERDQVFGLDQRAAALGLDYVEIRESHSFDRRVIPALGELIRERGIDIVHSHEYKTDLLAWWIARRTPVATLSTAHGWTGHTPRERFVYYPLNRRLLARFPLVIAVSSEIRASLVAAGADEGRVPVILNAIDHRMFRRDAARSADARHALGLGADDVVFGSVGRLEPQKRFDLLIEAFADLHRSDSTLRLLIAGEGSERPRLERAIRDCRLAGACRLLGHHHDVTGLHHALDFFVQSSDYEGTPNVVLEAMALETPIVATDVGGTAEICRPDVDGLIVAPGSASRLAAAMRTAIENGAATRDRVAHARSRVEHELSFDTRCRRLEDIYERLVTARVAA